MGSFETAKQLFLDGLDLLQGGDYPAAEAKFLASLERIPDRVSTLTNLSAVQFRLAKFDEAAQSAQRALAIDSSNADAWLNKGNSLHALGRYQEALDPYDRAIALKPENAEAWSNKGVALCSLRRFDEALEHHDRAIALNPSYAEGWSNKGLVLRECRQYDEALAHFERAIALRPDYAEAWSNLGLTLVDMRRREQALTHYDRAIALKPDFAQAWSHKAAALMSLGRYDDALEHYQQAIAVSPGADSVLAELIHAKLLAANWHDLERKASELVDKLGAGQAVMPPFVLLSVTDSPQLHLRAAQLWVNHKYPANPPSSFIPRNRHHRIRVGYFSADFRNHAVSFLTAELFEIHDRTRFEIVGFPLRAAGQDDEMRKRLEKGFDQFIDLEHRSDVAAAELCREMGIDIAVDLSGHTEGARSGVFSHRAAPVQVNYLGYPGTMGAEYMDYILADRTVVPDDERSFYSEKIVYLPHCFQPNDRHRTIAQHMPSREDLGLPGGSFVYCCFNNTYKINPAVFRSWMRILRDTRGSVLWLLASTRTIETSFRNAAKEHGVDPDRLVFGGRLPPAEYLARYRMADLALDTLPFNAGTTASDALWAGLPVLTRTGRSFSGRMASSLLQAVGLPELITQTREEYESAAIELATNPEKLHRIKQKLAANRLSTPLFDTPRLARHLEAAYTRMHERSQAGLPPEHLSIEP